MFQLLFGSKSKVAPTAAPQEKPFKMPKGLSKEEEIALVEQIHKEFNTASDKALEEAKRILNGVDTKMVDKANRLKKLGFTKSEAVSTAVSEEEKLKSNNTIAEGINYYFQKYPLYKFISEEAVIAICKKYSLVCGPISHFEADVPEKNIVQMENFSIYPDDICYTKKIREICWTSSLYVNDGTLHKHQQEVLKKFIATIKPIYGGYRRMTDTEAIEEQIRDFSEKSLGTGSFKKLIDQIYTNTVRCDDFLICAPAKDFDMTGLKSNSEFMMETATVINYTTAPVPDPVVLKRVPGGFLIVTAWGPEASDPLVVNQINN